MEVGGRGPARVSEPERMRGQVSGFEVLAVTGGGSVEK